MSVWPPFLSFSGLYLFHGGHVIDVLRIVVKVAAQIEQFVATSTRSLCSGIPFGHCTCKFHKNDRVNRVYIPKAIQNFNFKVKHYLELSLGNLKTFFSFGLLLRP